MTYLIILQRCFWGLLYIVVSQSSFGFLNKHLLNINTHIGGLPLWLSNKESTCKAENAGDAGAIPGSGRSLGWGHGNPFQYSFLENPMNRAVWWATNHGVTKGQTWLKQLNTHALSHIGELLSFPGSLPCIHIIKFLFNFILFIGLMSI